LLSIYVSIKTDFSVYIHEYPFSTQNHNFPSKTFFFLKLPARDFHICCPTANSQPLRKSIYNLVNSPKFFFFLLQKKKITINFIFYLINIKYVNKRKKKRV